jgi:anhydro-N-acetylmuramic acid kinase
VSEKLLVRWLTHPFFKRRPPKSTGRESFGEIFWRAEQRQIRAAQLSNFDVIATLTEFTARSLALNYKLHLSSPPQSVVLCGGGAKNLVLVSRIHAELRELDSSVKIFSSEDFDWPSSAIEPAAFALLAYFRWNKIPGNIPFTTGASRAVLLGQITE